jgi:hypothetical protein
MGIFTAFLASAILGLREIGQGLGITERSLFHVVIQLIPVPAELLLEKGINHHGGRAGVFHSFDLVDFFRERRGGNDERSAQLEAEIIR